MANSLDAEARRCAADEEATRTLLTDKAEELHRTGNHRLASAYDRAAAKAEDRAGVWRALLNGGR